MPEGAVTQAESPPPAPPSVPSLASASRAERRRISVVWALVANFGGLLIVAMLAVFGFAFWSASENTIDLLRTRSEQTLTLLQQRLRDHLDQPANQIKLMVSQVEERQQDPARQAEFDAFLAGAIAGLPQLHVLAYLRPDLTTRGAVRINGRITIRQVDMTGQPRVAQLVRAMWSTRRGGWTPPIYNTIMQQTVIAHAEPVLREGQATGVLVGVISTQELSAYVARVGREVGGTAFILYGHDRVLAHAGMGAAVHWKPSAEEPLPSLATFGDPVLAALWDKTHYRPRLFSYPPPLQARSVAVGDETYPVIYTELSGYSDRPLVVGFYVRTSDFRDIINRLIYAMIAGVGAIAGAIVMAVMIGRRLARPVRRISEAATLVGDLRIAEVRPLPRSRIREIDEQAHAFNAMTRALRWFETYVPKPLARHLLKDGDASQVASEHRHLTVMFTDIVGFSTLSENQSAAAVADYLNRHFSIVNTCIEGEGGIVDKYIGDSVMAFWGAPEKLKNRAERACRAALAIRAAIERDNADCRAGGLSETRMRIGIHSGDATVGNIGSASRVNYTIIGDMVNVGQRIEQLAKVIGPRDSAVTILISETTRADLDAGFDPRPLGHHKLRGRQGEMEIYAL
jgi:class 3 adenylate cyclase